MVKPAWPSANTPSTSAACKTKSSVWRPAFIQDITYHMADGKPRRDALPLGAARQQPHYRICGEEIRIVDTPTLDVKAVFDRAAEIEAPGDCEAAFLGKPAPGSRTSAGGVDALLRAYAQAGSLLDRPGRGPI